MHSLRKCPIIRFQHLRFFQNRQFCYRNINFVKYSIEPLERRGLLRVHGKESSIFLQGLVTNDMQHLEEGAPSMYTMFLNIRGRVICDTIIYRYENNTFLIEGDKDVLSTLQKHLKLYTVRKKINIDLIDDLCIWAVISKSILNENYDVALSDKFRNVIENEPENLDYITKIFQEIEIICRDPRLAALGYRLIVPSKDNFFNNKFSEEYQSSNGIYKQLRYKLGVGEGVAEIPPGKCFPLELNCDYLHGVSFHKGCYIGQELTARVHHIGVVRKRLMPVILNTEPTETFSPDARVENALDKKVIGKLCGLDKKYGLALLKVSEALSAPSLRLLNVTGSTVKPAWWPQEAPKDRTIGEKTEIDLLANLMQWTELLVRHFRQFLQKRQPLADNTENGIKFSCREMFRVRRRIYLQHVWTLRTF